VLRLPLLLGALGGPLPRRAFRVPDRSSQATILRLQLGHLGPQHGILLLQTRDQLLLRGHHLTQGRILSLQGHDSVVLPGHLLGQLVPLGPLFLQNRAPPPTFGRIAAIGDRMPSPR
jgi:hypothetical protein